MNAAMRTKLKLETVYYSNTHALRLPRVVDSPGLARASAGQCRNADRKVCEVTLYSQVRYSSKKNGLLEKPFRRLLGAVIGNCDAR